MVIKWTLFFLFFELFDDRVWVSVPGHYPKLMYIICPIYKINDQYYDILYEIYIHTYINNKLN